eukprot:6082406-Prorocentrum_lima.AAC.1
MGARSYGRRWWCCSGCGAAIVGCSGSGMVIRQSWWCTCGWRNERRCGVRICAQVGGVHGGR